MQMKRILLVGAIAMLFAYAVVAYHLRLQVLEGYSDFISFYTAGKIVGSGQGRRLYDLDLQYQVQQQQAPNVKTRAGALPFVRPAFEAWLFVPLASMSYREALGLWITLACVLLVVIAVLLRRHVPGLQQVPLVLLFLLLSSYFPVFITLLQGQDSVLLLLIFCLVFVELQKKKEKTGGILLGLGLFKFPLVVVFLIPFVVARRYRFLLGFCITALATIAVSIATTGWRAVSGYPRYLVGVNGLAARINDPRDMPNLRGLVEVAGGRFFSAFTLNVILALLSLTLVVWLATKHHLFVPGRTAVFSFAFCLDLFVMLLAGYHAHIFDLVLLVPALAICAGISLAEGGLRPPTRKVLLASVVCLMFSPLYLILSLILRATTLLALLELLAVMIISWATQDVQSGGKRQHDAVPASDCSGL